MNRRRGARGPRAGLARSGATWVRVTAAASSAAVIGTLGLTGTSMAATGSAAHAAKAARPADGAASSCHLGNGVKHVVDLTFDNVH